MLFNILNKILLAATFSFAVSASALGASDLAAVQSSIDLTSDQSTVRETTVSPPMSLGSGEVLAQGPAFGARCVTDIGWCPISPQPVGAPCTDRKSVV